MLNFNRDSFFVLALFVLVCPWIATCQEGGDGEPVEPLSGYNFAGSDHSDDTAYTALPSDRGTIHDPSWVYDSLGEATLGGNDRGSIRCKGYYPSAFAGVGPASENNINSLAELCADQAFGGGMWRQGRRATSNGAFCAWFLSPPTLVFSRQTSARLSLDDWHRWMFCQTKCTCQHEAAIPMMASVSEMLIDSMRPLYRDSFPQVISIVQGGYPTSYYEPNSVRHAIPLVSMPNGMSSPPINIRGIHLRKGIVSGAIINQLYCEGERPAWLDAIVRRYFTTQRLCAATFLGGQPNANAGGFCYDPDKNAFAFKEEFTSPIYAQTPSSANAYEANTQPPNEDELSAEENTFVVHLWCRVHCACKAPRKNGVVNKPSNTIRGYGEANWKNGEFTFTSLPRSPGAPPAIETLLGSAPLAPGEAPKSNRYLYQSPQETARLPSRTGKPPDDHARRYGRSGPPRAFTVLWRVLQDEPRLQQSASRRRVVQVCSQIDEAGETEL
ncbi:MAG: hypothetical protein M1814_005145 [Vezdaea aestivalis]|nr:MAG: hypothetical protein M1814_005145 [Vezdaea aestivalis]